MRRTPFANIFLLIAFLFNSVITVPIVQAQPAWPAGREIALPKPGVMVHLSPPVNPAMLKGMKVNPNNPFRFEFILDKGDSVGAGLAPAQEGQPQGLPVREESIKLIKYFLASLTIPEKDLWVNLSPYEKDRIVPESFGITEMGRDLLAQDYILKQVTASLIYPEDEVGKKFWKRVYEEAAKKYGNTNIPVNTFNKVWIVPEKAVVYENAKAGTAYVVESKLKVMLEEDYLSLEKNTVGAGLAPALDKRAPARGARTDVNQIGSQIVREIVIPELTKEVNEGKNFAQLRQVYNSLILATWYKKKIKDSILSKVYADRNKIAGIGINSVGAPLAGAQDVGAGASPARTDVESIYQQYLAAFKKGVYNYIKDDIDPITQERTPRKYFSGGVKWDMAMMTITSMAPSKLPDQAIKVDVRLDQIEIAEAYNVDSLKKQSATLFDTSRLTDLAMLAEEIRDEINQSLAGGGDIYFDAVKDRDELTIGYGQLRGMIINGLQRWSNLSTFTQLLLDKKVITPEIAQHIPIFVQIEQLANENVDFGLQAGRMYNTNKPFYDKFRILLEGYPYADNVANTLARIQEGHIKLLALLGVLKSNEADVLIAKSEAGIERVWGREEDQTNLKERIQKIIQDYEALSAKKYQLMQQRLIPRVWLGYLAQYFEMSYGTFTQVISTQRSFLKWIMDADVRVKEIQSRVGGRSNAWFIVVAQGLDKLDDYLMKAEPLVKEIESNVGGSGNAWHIVIAQGLDKSKDWVARAKLKVASIELQVGRLSSAWSIVLAQGVEKTDLWMREASLKVDSMEKKGISRAIAWHIVIKQGVEDADEWIKNAEVKVSQIKDRVGGKSVAWEIVLGWGIENVDVWVEKAEVIVNQIKEKVSGKTNAWIIVKTRGIKNTKLWVENAELKVQQILPQMDNLTDAWFVVISQGIENAQSYVRLAKAKVLLIQEKVGGSGNAWKIVLNNGLSNVDSWMSKVEPEVDKILALGEKTRTGAWREFIQRDQISTDEAQLSNDHASIIEEGIDSIKDEAMTIDEEKDMILRQLHDDFDRHVLLKLEITDPELKKKELMKFMIGNPPRETVWFLKFLSNQPNSIEYLEFFKLGIKETQNRYVRLVSAHAIARLNIYRSHRTMLKVLKDHFSLVNKVALEYFEEFGIEEDIPDLIRFKEDLPEEETYIVGDDHGQDVLFTKPRAAVDRLNRGISEAKDITTQNLKLKGEITRENIVRNEIEGIIVKIKTRATAQRKASKVDLNRVVKDKVLLDFLNMLKKEGLEDVVVIGGGVRDGLQGLEGNDLDISVAVPLNDDEYRTMIPTLSQTNERVYNHVMNRLKELSIVIGRRLGIEAPDFLNKNKKIFWVMQDAEGRKVEREIQYAGPIMRKSREDGSLVYIKRGLVDLTSLGFFSSGVVPTISELAIDCNGQLYGHVEAIEDLNNGDLHFVGDPRNLDIGGILRGLRLRHQSTAALVKEKRLLRITDGDWEKIRNRIKYFNEEPVFLSEPFMLEAQIRQFRLIARTAINPDAALAELTELGITDLFKRRHNVDVAAIFKEELAVSETDDAPISDLAMTVNKVPEINAASLGLRKGPPNKAKINNFINYFSHGTNAIPIADASELANTFSRLLPSSLDLIKQWGVFNTDTVALLKGDDWQSVLDSPYLRDQMSVFIHQYDGFTSSQRKILLSRLIPLSEIKRFESMGIGRNWILDILDSKFDLVLRMQEAKAFVDEHTAEMNGETFVWRFIMRGGIDHAKVQFPLAKKFVDENGIYFKKSARSTDSGRTSAWKYISDYGFERAKEYVESLKLKKDKDMSSTGGIDFNSDQMNLQTRNEGEAIEFKMNPALLTQLLNAPGLYPVIINIQPMTNIRLFLGLDNTQPQSQKVLT